MNGDLDETKTLLANMRDAAKRMKQSELTSMRRAGEGVESVARELEQRPEEIEAFLEEMKTLAWEAP